MNISRRFIYFFTIGLLLFFVGSYYSSPGRSTQDVFVIEQGESANSVVERLVEIGLVRSRIIFLWELRNSGQATKLQPGEHYLGDVVSYRQIIERLVSGNLASPEATLLIREGETLREIKIALEANDLAAAAELYVVTGEPAKFPSGTAIAGHRAVLQEKYAWLATVPKDASLEGFLFPD
ncbi:endolytic transglycosylase MltG, partial [Patescibacteria group bacterium]|nr:endolytic transglycosylase MltG [Patescibacteria group bacterium]